MVQSKDWEAPELTDPIEEMSLDGGMVRLRTPLGCPCEWKEYKALNVHERVKIAYFKDNEGLLSWVKAQPLAAPFACLGDGHDGVWNIFAQIGTAQEREEILDWYHLMENAHKIRGTPQQKATICHLLWTGQIPQTFDYLRTQKGLRARDFWQYLKKHRTRLINYQARQADGGSIGSGAVESLVKQIALRVKLPGAQWSKDNVPKLLKHRCAYLNGAFSL